MTTGSVQEDPQDEAATPNSPTAEALPQPAPDGAGDCDCDEALIDGYLPL